MNLYEQNGFSSREAYLIDLAKQYDLPLIVVIREATRMGDAEDFDGLLSALSDIKSTQPKKEMNMENQNAEVIANIAPEWSVEELEAVIKALEAHLDEECTEYEDLSDNHETAETDLKDLTSEDFQHDEQEDAIEKWLRRNDEQLSVGNWSISLEQLLENGDDELREAILNDMDNDIADFYDEADTYQEHIEARDALEIAVQRKDEDIQVIKCLIEDFKHSLAVAIEKRDADPVMAAIAKLQAQVNLINQQIVALQASVFGGQ